MSGTIYTWMAWGSTRIWLFAAIPVPTPWHNKIFDPLVNHPNVAEAGRMAFCAGWQATRAPPKKVTGP